MKRIASAIAVVLTMAAFSIPAFADDDDGSTSFGTRYYVGADFKLAKGFHLDVGEELRLGNDFGFDRSYTSGELSYKFNKHFKGSLGYEAIAVLKNKYGTDYIDWRHRGYLSLTESCRAGNWRFSLKETFRATWKTAAVNQYQRPQTYLHLKGRFRVAYKPDKAKFEPYAFVEGRLLLNGASWGSTEAGSTDFLGYTDMYLNRIRGQVGVKYDINKHNSLELYSLYDYMMDKQIDSKRSTAYLKEAISTSLSSRVAVGLSYVYSF